MSNKRFIFGLLTLCAFFFIVQTTGAADKNRPNIIYIYTSDLGKGLLSVYGQKHFTTPNIDALINNGLSFSKAYGGSTTAYARASLYTGYFDCRKDKWRIIRGGAYTKGSAYIDIDEREINANDLSLPENDLYLPQVFKKAGYVTAQIGLLGMGNISTRQQIERYGWDYSYGYLDFEQGRGYYPPFLFENEKIITIEGNTRNDCGVTPVPESENAYKERWNMNGKEVYSPDLFINKTIEFIRMFKDGPFYLMFNTQLPHGPVSIPAVHPEVANNDALTPVEKEYASMVKLLDDQVGIIMSELRSLGLEENTIIIFASDNGHEIHYQQIDHITRPFRNIKNKQFFDNLHNKYYSDRAGDVFNGNAGMAGVKYSNLDGGIHIPLVFYWKGNLKKGVCNEIVSNCDFLPTMADFLGVNLSVKKDGTSFLPALMKGRKLPKNQFIVASSSEGPTIITNEGWKLRYHLASRKYELYNLDKDPEEKYDVILRFPEKAEELKKILLQICDGRIENGVVS